MQDLGVSGLKSMGLIYVSIINQAYMLATDDIFKLSGWVFMVLLGITWLAKPTVGKQAEGIAAE